MAWPPGPRRESRCEGEIANEKSRFPWREAALLMFFGETFSAEPSVLRCMAEKGLFTESSGKPYGRNPRSAERARGFPIAPGPFGTATSL